MEVLNFDGHKDVYIHVDNVPSEQSPKVSNGTRFEVIAQEGDAMIFWKDGKKYGVKQRHCKVLASLPRTGAPQLVEVVNVDGHNDVYIHLDNVPGETSTAMSNGTRFRVVGEEGDAYIVLKDGKIFGVKQRHCKRLPAAPSTAPPEA